MADPNFDPVTTMRLDAGEVARAIQQGYEAAEPFKDDTTKLIERHIEILRRLARLYMAQQVLEREVKDLQDRCTLASFMIAGLALALFLIWLQT